MRRGWRGGWKIQYPMESCRWTCLNPGGFQTEPGIPFGALLSTKTAKPNRTEPKTCLDVMGSSKTRYLHNPQPRITTLFVAFFPPRQRHSHHFIRLCRHATLPSMCNSLPSRASKRAQKKKERQPESLTSHRLSVQPPERDMGNTRREWVCGITRGRLFLDGGG